MPKSTKQTPKSDHPWRQYANKKKPKTDKEEIVGIITVEEWVRDLGQGYKEREVSLTVSFEGSKLHKLKNLPQEKQAAYIAGFLKRNYGK